MYYVEIQIANGPDDWEWDLFREFTNLKEALECFEGFEEGARLVEYRERSIKTLLEA